MKPKGGKSSGGEEKTDSILGGDIKAVGE